MVIGLIIAFGSPPINSARSKRGDAAVRRSGQVKPTTRAKKCRMFVETALLHLNVTEHPTAAWTSQQIVEAFGDRDAPRYLLRDRDGIYGNDVRRRIASLHMEEILTAPRSPWQNPYAERLIGSIRRDCLNHFVILNARHLRRTLASYFAYYHGSRTHLGLDKQCPFPRQVSSIGRIIEIPQLGGLHHRYERVAA